jgi:hypothetical protein
MGSARNDIFYLGEPATVPVAYCRDCRTEVIVWADVWAEEPDPIPRCATCDGRLDEFGVDPGVTRVSIERVGELGLEVVDRPSAGGCTTGGCGTGASAGGGCATGGCADAGGGGGCWTAAQEGGAAKVAAEGVRGCASCGVKTECAETSRAVRAGDLVAAKIASTAKRDRTTALRALVVL